METTARMADPDLMHDAAYAGATALLDLVRLPPAAAREFHRNAYEVILATLEGYEARLSRASQMRGPSRN